MVRLIAQYWPCAAAAVDPSLNLTWVMPHSIALTVNLTVPSCTVAPMCTTVLAADSVACVLVCAAEVLLCAEVVGIWPGLAGPLAAVVISGSLAPL
jgi:hypothetical protein